MEKGTGGIGVQVANVNSPCVVAGYLQGVGVGGMAHTFNLVTLTLRGVGSRGVVPLIFLTLTQGTVERSVQRVSKRP